MKSFLAACGILILCGHSLGTDDVDFDDFPSPFTPLELQNLADAVQRAANEKNFLRERLDMLFMQKQELSQRLDDVEDKVFTMMVNSNNNQDNRLNNIKDRIKNALHRLSNLESEVAANDVLSRVIVKNINTNDIIIDEQQADNREQSAKLSKIQAFLALAKRTLEEKLTAATDEASNDINSVNSATTDFACLVDSKQCIVDVVEVFVDAENGVGNASVAISFSGNSVPVVSCGLLGFNSSIAIGGVRHYSGYGYGNKERQELGLVIDCKPFDDRVEVRAFDHSRGTGNQHFSAKVQVKACTFAALA